MGSNGLCLKQFFSSSYLVTLSLFHLVEECNKMEDKDTDEEWEEWNEEEEEEEW
jgi:hypothetical protein